MVAGAVILGIFVAYAAMFGFDKLRQTMEQLKTSKANDTSPLQTFAGGFFVCGKNPNVWDLFLMGLAWQDAWFQLIEPFEDAESQTAGWEPFCYHSPMSLSWPRRKKRQKVTGFRRKSKRNLSEKRGSKSRRRQLRQKRI